MENATDALKIAGSVLLFVLALSVVIPLISQARETADKIMSYIDRETDYIEGKFFYEENNTKQRTVGIETVIPSIYRSYKENFKVVFLYPSGDALNFYKYGGHGEYKPYNRIDTIDTSVPTGSEKEFLDGIFYHTFKTTTLPGVDNKTAFEKKYLVKIENVNGKSLFEYIKDKNMTEDIGVYYQDDLIDATRGKPESNKDEKRVITYTVQP